MALPETGVAELSAEEKALRQQGLGASEIAAIAGVNPWRSALDVWLVKTGKKRDRESQRTKMGQRMEAVIGEWYMAQHEERWSWSKPKTIVHPTIPWAMATPDLIGSSGDQKRRCEIKLVGSHLRDHWHGGLNVPGYVYCQVLWQGFVTGIEIGDVAVWFGLDEDDQRVIPVRYDVEVVDDLAELADNFWNRNVKRDIPPAVESTEDWGEYLAKRYPRSAAPAMPAPPGARELVQAYLAADQRERLAAAAKREAKNEIMAMLGFHESMVGEGFKVSWKSDKNGHPNYKAVAESLGATPELIAKHTSDPPRRFIARETK